MCRDRYWQNPKIHNFGNVGLMGLVHALIAPTATRAITQLAYGGVEPRTWLHARIPSAASVVDFGCGTGVSTRNGSTGVDTSGEMLAVARRLFPHKEFAQGNAETWGEEDGADVTTVCFLLHEAPREGRLRIIENAARVARRHTYIMDIHPAYTPSPMMLTGEPYLPDYLSHIDEDVVQTAHTLDKRLHTRSLLRGRVRLWLLS